MISERTYCFLINCASNSFKAESLFKQKEQELSKRFPDSEFIYIRKGDSIRDIARNKAAFYTHIVACGGDGTVSQTANGLMNTNATMGVIPMGSGNDFAQNIGLTLNGSFEDHVIALEKNKVTSIDLIEGEWGYVINSFGLGVDGLTNYYSNLSGLKNGSARYFWAALKALILAKPFELTLVLKEQDLLLKEKVWMIAIANGRTEGGKYIISPNSLNNDGLVELIVVKSISRLRLLYEFIKLSLGYPFYSNVVHELKADKMFTIKTEHPVKAHADGEQVSGPVSFDFKLCIGGLKVVTGHHPNKG